MADDPNAMLAALTARGGAPGPGEPVPLPPPRPKGIDEYADPAEADAEHAMIAEQMGGTPNDADLPRGRSNEDGLTQEQLQDIVRQKGELRAHLENMIFKAPPARDMSPRERAYGLTALKSGMGGPFVPTGEAPKPRSMMAVDGYREPEGILNNRLIDRRNPFMTQSGGQGQLHGGTPGVALPTYAVPTKQADRFFPNRWDLPRDPLVARMVQAGDEDKLMNNIMGKNTDTKLTPGLSPDPEDEELRHWVSSRMGSERPETNQPQQPQQPNVMSFLSRLLGR